MSSRLRPIEAPALNFDTQEGSLIIGKAALEFAFESGVDPRDIQDLGSLLTDKPRAVGANDLPKVTYPDWSPADDINYVKWLDKVASQEANTRVSEEVITRAGYLGIGPRVSHFKGREQGLSGLYREAKLSGTRTRQAFQDWDTADYVRYVNRMAKRLGRKPNYDDLVNAGRRISNPTPTQIIRSGKFENLGALFELSGFVYVKNWIREDFIDWGVRFMEANDGKMPGARAMEVLSAKSRGPHPCTIYDRDDFASLWDFQTAALKAYEAKMHDQAILKQNKLQSLADEAARDDTFAGLVSELEDLDQTLVMRARYLVARRLVPDPSPKRLLRVCGANDTQAFVGMILRAANGHLSARDIEHTALELDVFTELWPLDDHKTLLKVA